jgi:prepilin-type N-terminal cleavage/methylation domain-containing protein
MQSENLQQEIKGFTLIEMMVAVTIFSIVMLVAVGALVTIVDTHRKARTLEAVINNLNFAVESMTRTARVGYNYYCNLPPGDPNPPPAPPGQIDVPQDCSGGRILAFEEHDGDPDDVGDQIVYRLNGTKIELSTEGGANGTFVDLTSEQVTVEEFRIFVSGSERTDEVQPKIHIIIRGRALLEGQAESTFDIQTTVTQRILDIP